MKSSVPQEIFSSHDEPLRVMALHSLAYCPRLFYFTHST